MAVVGIAGIVARAVPAGARSAQYVWNLTASAPAGLYRITHTPWIRGDRVAVLPGEALAGDLERRGVLSRGKLLIKRVAASSGDRVCREKAIVSINGVMAAKAREFDSFGKLLPSWQGCISLDEDHVFLMGDTPDSYDGRYFGVTTANEIIGRSDLV